MKCIKCGKKMKAVSAPINGVPDRVEHTCSKCGHKHYTAG